jgi:hypothetical protein
MCFLLLLLLLQLLLLPQGPVLIWLARAACCWRPSAHLASSSISTPSPAAAAAAAAHNVKHAYVCCFILLVMFVPCIQQHQHAMAALQHTPRQRSSTALAGRTTSGRAAA